MKNPKIRLVILCLLTVRSVGTPRFDGATFFMENEIWKDVIGYEGFYQVSNQGRLRSVERIVPREYRGPVKVKEKIINWHKIKGGYFQVGLSKDGKGQKQYLISRLVAIHFIPNPLNLPEVNHKFGDKSDNRAISLEWMTVSDNRKHAFANGFNKNLYGAAARNAKPVFDSTTGIGYGCITDALLARGIKKGCYMTRRHRNKDNMGIIIL